MQARLKNDKSVVAPPPSGAAIYALLLLTLASVLSFIDRQIITILLGPIKTDLQLTDSAMGFLTGMAFAIVYIFLSFPVAMIADRSDKRVVMSACVAAWSAMTMLCGLAHGFWHLALARAGVAAGEAGANPASQSMVAEMFPENQRTRALGVLALGPSIGIFFGLFLGGWIATHWNWRVAFIAVGAPGIVLALVIRFTMGRHMPVAAQVHDRLGLRAGLHDLWKVRTFRYAMLALGFHSLAGYGWTTWAPTFLVRVHHMSLMTVGTWLGLATAIGVILGTILSAMLADRLGKARWLVLIPAAGGVLSSFFAVITALASTGTIAILCYVPMIAAFASWAPTIYSLAQGLAGKRNRALAAAVVGFFSTFIGTGLGPTIVGVLNDLFASHGTNAVRSSLLLIIPAMLVGSILFLVAARSADTDIATRARQPE